MFCAQNRVWISGSVASFIAEVGCLFLRVRPAIWESCRQKVHRTVARARFDSICISNFKKMACSEHFWKMRSANVHQTSPDCIARFALENVKLKNWHALSKLAKCAGDCSESWTLQFYIKFLKETGTFGARMLVDLVQRCGFATACDKTLWHRRAGKHSVMLRRSWQAGLQLEVVKHIVTASRKVGFNHSATLVLCGIAAGGCKTHCAGCAKRRIGLQKLQKR